MWRLRTATLELGCGRADPVRKHQRRRTYITGGVGSRHEDESIGLDYELAERSRLRRNLSPPLHPSCSTGEFLPPATRPTSTKSSAHCSTTCSLITRRRPRLLLRNTLHMRERGTVLEDSTLQVRAESGCAHPGSRLLLPDERCTYIGDRSPPHFRPLATTTECNCISTATTTSRRSSRAGCRLSFRFAPASHSTAGSRSKSAVSPAVEFTLGLRVPGWAHGAHPRTPRHGDCRRARPHRRPPHLRPGRHPATFGADRAYVRVAAPEYRRRPRPARRHARAARASHLNRLTCPPASTSMTSPWMRPSPPNGLRRAQRPPSAARLSRPGAANCPTSTPSPGSGRRATSRSTSSRTRPGQIAAHPRCGCGSRTCPHSPAPGTGVGDHAREPQRAKTHPIETKMSIAPREETQ